MNDVKIIFIDIDGTLRDSNDRISDDTIKSINKLQKEGIQIVLATGRSLKYTINLVKLYNSGNYIITSNGAEVYNYKSNNMIYSSPLDKDSIAFIDDIIKKNNLLFIANTSDYRYTNKNEDAVGMKKCSSLLDISDSINQVVVQSTSSETMATVKLGIESNTKIRIANKNDNTTNKYLFYDITNSDVSKGNSIVKLCEYLNISLDKTMAIGNSNNDLDMFKVCKYKVAVANADLELKKESNIETLSNDSEGVKVILDRLYNEITK